MEGFLSYLVSFAIVAVIYAVFSLGLNVQWGFTGLFNIGIAGFFAIGAYTAALLTVPPAGQFANYVLGLNLPFLVGIVAAGAVSGIVALLIAIPTLRLREDYLAIATLGIAESIRLVFNNERWLANGSRGMVGLPQPLHNLVAPDMYNYIYLGIVVVFLVIVYVAIQRAISSPWGRVLRAIRENETTTLAVGKNVSSFKVQAFVFGAVIMGIGGALYAHYARTISPETFTPLFGTFIIWVMLTLGGSGSNKGAILGAFLVWGIWTGTDFITDLAPRQWATQVFYVRYLAIGLILVAIVLVRPQGILGEARRVSMALARPQTDEKAPQEGTPPEGPSETPSD
jgi:branched-chain amino acid transport system permease protein